MTKQVPLNAVLELTAKFGGILQDLAAIVGENTTSSVATDAEEAKVEEAVSEGVAFLKSVKEKMNPTGTTADKPTARGRKRKSAEPEAVSTEPVKAEETAVEPSATEAPVSDEDFFGEKETAALTMDSFKDQITQLITTGRKFDAQFANKNVPILLGQFKAAKLPDVFNSGKGQEFIDALKKVVSDQEKAAA